MLKITVPIIGVAVAVVLLLAATMLGRMWWCSPPSVLGFSVLNLAEGPEQPIAFPHTVHVQDAGLDCQFCHRTVTSEETAGIPAVEQCLFCHDLGRIDGSKFDASGNKIPGTQSPEIEKILNDNKAIEVKSINLKDKTSIADFMICLLYTSPSPRDRG